MTTISHISGSRLTYKGGATHLLFPVPCCVLVQQSILSGSVYERHGCNSVEEISWEGCKTVLETREQQTTMLLFHSLAAASARGSLARLTRRLVYLDKVVWSVENSDHHLHSDHHMRGNPTSGPTASTTTSSTTTSTTSSLSAKCWLPLPRLSCVVPTDFPKCLLM